MSTEVNNDLIKDYLDAQIRKADSTMKVRRVALQSLNSYVDDLRTSSPKEVDAWMSHLKENGRKNTTINQYLTAVKDFYGWLMDNIEIGLDKEEVRQNVRKQQSYSKIKKIPPLDEYSKKKKKLERKDIKYLLEKSKERATHHYRFIALGLIFGFRKMELLELKTDFVDFKNMEVNIPPELAKTKSSKRSIPVPSWSKSVLRPDGEYVIGANGGSEPYSESMFNAALNNYENSSTGHIYPHRLRITFNTFMVEKGVPNFIIKKLMGHKTDKDMTDYYRGESSTLDDQKRKVMEEKHYMKPILDEIGEV